MNNLTKDECMKALESRLGTRCYGSCKKYASKDCVECQKGWGILYDLINEHFNNQLTVEEIDALIDEVKYENNNYIETACKKLEKQKKVLQNGNMD